MQKSEEIIKQFDGKIPTLSRCSESMLRLIKNILDAKKINYHNIAGRIKDRERLKEKIVRKAEKYQTLEDITDIIGIRIITYFEDEVDKVAQIINQEFLIDPENSIDKRINENDRFGYRSLHYVVSVSKDRLRLTEYEEYAGIKIEIQIRSILQHSWAEIEHDLGYKGEFEIPDVAKRTFYRLSALLEVADLEFVRLKNVITEYEHKVTKELTENKTEIQIDKTSLVAYIHQSGTISSQIKPIGKIYNFSGEFEIGKEVETSGLILRLKKLQILTINQLDKSLKENQSESLQHFQQRYQGHKISKLNPAAPIYILVNFLEAKNSG